MNKELYTYGICFFRDEKYYYKKFRKILKALNTIFLKIIDFDNYGSFYFDDDKIVYKINNKQFYWVDLDKDIELLEKITRIKGIMIYRANSNKTEIVKKGNEIFSYYYS